MGNPASPVRMRLSRKAGFNLQAESRALNGLAAVNVGRPSMWGNYAAVRAGVPTGKPAVQAFELWFSAEASEAWKGRVGIDLRGRNLACWCALPAPGEPDHCHAAVLLRLANAPIRCDALPATRETVNVG